MSQTFVEYKYKDIVCECPRFLESVVMVLDVDDPCDGLNGPVTGDILPVTEVEIHSPVRGALLEYLDSPSHSIRVRTPWPSQTLNTRETLHILIDPMDDLIRSLDEKCCVSVSQYGKFRYP